MKWQIAITLMVVTVVTCDESKYTARYDSINPQDIIDNPKILYNYLDCLLDKGRCAPEAKELKVHIKDALQTGCKKCTDKQKASIKKLLDHIRHKEIKYWEELKAKYDPNNEYQATYEAFIAG